MAARSIAVVALAVALALAGCSGRCVDGPCRQPLAFTLTLTSSAGGPVPDPRISLPGTSPQASLCAVGGSTSTCNWDGYAGTYVVTIEAPGFQTATRTIVVKEGVSPEREVNGETGCPCPATVPEHLDVVLTPSP